MSYRNSGCLVRHESFGPLIWSGKLGGYFLALDSHTAELVEEAAAGGTATEAYSGQLGADLTKLGFQDGLRVIRPETKELSAPLEMYFDFTWLCNLANAKCGRDSYCYAAPFLGNVTMVHDKVRRVIQELYEWGVMRLHLAGGEPTSVPKALENYLATAREFNMMTSMSTNGVKISDNLADVMLDSGLYSITFSIDGHDEGSFAQVRGPGYFDKVIGTFTRFREKRDRLSSQTILCVKPTIAPDTPRSTVVGLIELAIKLGADAIKFSSPERCLHHAAGHYGRVADEYYDMAFFLRELQNEFAGRIRMDGINNPLAGGCREVGLPNRQGCIGAQELLALNPNGRISPCLMHNLELGRLGQDCDSLREFWQQSAKLRSFWGALESPSECASCTLHGSCRSGSVVRRIVERGEFSAAGDTGAFIGTKDRFARPTIFAAGRSAR